MLAPRKAIDGGQGVRRHANGAGSGTTHIDPIGKLVKAIGGTRIAAAREPERLSEWPCCREENDEIFAIEADIGLPGRTLPFDISAARDQAGIAHDAGPGDRYPNRALGLPPSRCRALAKSQPAMRLALPVVSER
jgi:hypothetical protein